jgi:multisubunit Na+/H+ antiporter MnhC subunit
MAKRPTKKKPEVDIKRDVQQSIASFRSYISEWKNTATNDVDPVVSMWICTAITVACTVTNLLVLFVR